MSLETSYADPQELRRWNSLLFPAASAYAESDEEYFYIPPTASRPTTRSTATSSNPAYHFQRPPSVSNGKPAVELCREHNGPEKSPMLQVASTEKRGWDAELPSIYDDDSIERALPDLDREAWALRRGRALATEAPSNLGRHQTICWYLCRRPRDNFLAAAALLIALLSALVLVFLVFILFVRSTGRMGPAVNAVAVDKTKTHQDILRETRGLEGPRAALAVTPAAAIAPITPFD